MADADKVEAPTSNADTPTDKPEVKENSPPATNPEAQPAQAEDLNNDDMSSLSPVSSADVVAEEAEINGADATNGKDSPTPPPPPPPNDTSPGREGDEEMADAPPAPAPENDDEDDEPVVSNYPKRKRASNYKEHETDYDDNDESTLQGEEPQEPQESAEDPPSSAAARGIIKRHGQSGVVGVVVGYWRDSPAPTKEEKHSVIGFIDVRDRLRTRIQNITLSGAPVDTEKYPIPRGPGGSWTTFERVVFETHLVGLDQFQIKEFVKIRSGAEGESPQAKSAADKQAVREAIRRVASNPPPDTPANAAPAIAYGESIPDYVLANDDERKKKRRLGSGAASIIMSQAPPQQFAPIPAPPSVMTPPMVAPAPAPAPPPPAALPQPSQAPMMPAPMPAPAPAPVNAVMPYPPMPNTSTLNNLKGQRPTRILVGVWKHSSERTREDRHAVYGILGINDMFRVKVVRETQDGRFMDGNFPSGAGALWITYDQVELDPHLAPLSRAEVKEYVRYRQYQIDQGEPTQEIREQNIRVAVEQAKARWAIYEAANNLQPGGPAVHEVGRIDMEDYKPQQYGPGRHINGNGVSPKMDPGMPEPRNGLRSSMQGQRETRAMAQPPVPIEPRPDGRRGRYARQSLPNRAIEPKPTTRSRRSSAEAMERSQALARREVERAEAAVERDARHESRREMRSVTNRTEFNQNIERLDKVWQAQEESRINKYQAEDAKIHLGIKYERKATGPFQGKLVSQPAIINIDGEDYVEYRVLTKPIF